MNIFRKPIQAIVLLAAALLPAACADDETPFDQQPDNLPDEITITLAVPDFKVDEISSRAVNESALASVTVLGYNAASQCVSFETYTSADIVIDNGNPTMRITLPKNVTRIELAANASSILSSKPSTPLSEVWNTAELASASDLMLWGKANVSELLDSGYMVTMTRQTAKIAVYNSATTTFNMNSARVCNTATRGSLAPTLDGSGNPQLTTWASDPCSANSDYVSAGVPVYVYETPANSPYVIIRGLYNGHTNYYKIGLYSPSTNTRVDLQRNHYYTLTIKSVLGEGFSTEAEAIASDFSNRVIVELKDHNENIYNLIGTNDYALGVSDDLHLEAGATIVQTKAIIIASNTSLFLKPSVTIDPSCSAWLNSAIVSDSYETVNGTDGYTSPSRVYTVTLSLLANNTSTALREGAFTVKFRDLAKTVKIAQEGTDFKRDDTRKVQLAINGATVTSDYFYWLDNTLKGATPDRMSNYTRNEGLHFSTETDAATYRYLIPYKTGDAIKSVGRSDISVVRNGSNWEVKLTQTSAATVMWISNFILTNAAGIDIEYPVYRTGILHNITASVANTYQLSETRHSGWYYYETVAVKGTDGKTYYILDRNLGADGNGPFSLASAELSSNSNTVGAYYKISQTKNDNIKPSICPAGFTIPSAAEINAIGFTAGQFYTAIGEKYYSASIATDGSKSCISRIYLPTGGYVEGNNYKNSNHANIWSSSYLSDAQGFSPSSPEYKYWFLYFNAYDSKVNISNMRFVNGGGGNAGTIYKGMPIRCVRGNSSAANSSGGSSGASTDQTIYFDNSGYSWATPYAYIWKSSSGTAVQTWPGSAMTKVSGNTWTISVPAGYDRVIFSNNGASQTVDLKLVNGVTYTSSNINNYKAN